MSTRSVPIQKVLDLMKIVLWKKGQRMRVRSLNPGKVVFKKTKDKRIYMKPLNQPLSCQCVVGRPS